MESLNGLLQTSRCLQSVPASVRLALATQLLVSITRDIHFKDLGILTMVINFLRGCYLRHCLCLPRGNFMTSLCIASTVAPSPLPIFFHQDIPRNSPGHFEEVPSCWYCIKKHFPIFKFFDSPPNKIYLLFKIIAH